MIEGAFDIRYRGVDGRARKHSFEPTIDGFMRIERVYRDGEWREVGREPVEDVALETNNETVEVR